MRWNALRRHLSRAGGFVDFLHAHTWSFLLIHQDFRAPQELTHPSSVYLLSTLLQPLLQRTLGGSSENT